jgi:hypothetical protein
MKNKILVLGLLIVSSTSLFADIIVKGRARVNQGDAGDTEIRCRGRRGECLRISDGAIVKVDVFTERGTETLTGNSYSLKENNATNEEEFETLIILNKK